MDKKVIILAALAAVGGVGLAVLRSPERKGAQADESFPPEKLQGYETRTEIKVLESGKGGRPVLAVATMPYGIKPEQVSPTGYGALKALRRQYPKSDWISVFMAEDSAMAAASNWVGVAELRQGKVTVTGGIPTQAQIDSLAKLGNPLRRPTPADLKAVATVYDSAGSLSAERWDLSQALLGAGSGRIDKSGFLKLDIETTALHSAAKSLGMAPKDLQALVQGVTLFYWANAGEPL